MSKFKAGDRVRCVEAGSVYFTKGKEYLVTSGTDSETELRIKDNDGDVISPALSRFELVTDTPRPDPVQWLKDELIRTQTAHDAATSVMVRNIALGKIELCKAALFQIYGIGSVATTTTRTEWTFSPVQP